MSGASLEKRRVHSLKYYHANREKVLEKQKEYKKSIPREKELYRMAKSRALKFGIPFEITVKDIIIPELCPVFGIEMDKNTEFTSSLDRINPKLGYIKGNVQVISMKANRIKNDSSPDELRKFAEWVLKQSTL